MPEKPTPTGSHGPTASIDVLRRRARLLEQARHFFAQRGYWEVETPLLSADTCVDAHIDPITLTVDGERRFLQTSPEFAMKRLLAAGSGSIFQIAHAFRAGESGVRHNREFTLIEWYKVGATYHGLMDEVSHLVSFVGGFPRADRQSYRAAFLKGTGLDPLAATEERLWQLAHSRGLASRPTERDDLLNFIWADRIEPSLGQEVPTFIFDYPATQAALSKTRTDREGAEVAERFELYIDGIELCNGYQELTDAVELRRRFERQNRLRVEMGNNALPVDSRLLAAMEEGLPECAGVALGLERLLLLITGDSAIADVLPFPDDRA